MAQYLLRRAGHALLVIVGVTVVVFFVMRMTGDPTMLLVPLDASPEDIARLRHSLGFDRPLLAQFVDYLKGAAVLDFGNSMRHREPAMKLVLERMPATLQLTFLSLGFAVLVSVPLGVLSATRRSSVVDNVGSLVGVIGQMPVYWLGILLILVFAVWLKVLPAGGRGEGELKYLILPTVTLGAFSMASLFRILRSGMLDVLRQDYIKTARAKGLSERVITYKHALRNALVPVLTVLGFQLGTLLGGAVITETVFAWPGVGRFVVQAIFNRDFFVVQAAVVFLALMIVAINLATDLLYSAIDPRIRAE